ncbi:MAG TPA: hypothetical protein VK966_02030, partial [Longimicrobiales bacterium]|nr:hypothetical protein [Longimicrobiales bacterium]
MLTALLFAGLAVIPRQDTVSQRAASPGPEELARAASTAAYRYESRLWRLVPTTPGGSRPDRCHEVVGRFCLWHDSPGSPPPPPPDSVPAAVEEARVVAVRAHRLWFSAAPHNTRAAGALVRFLIEDGRTREAVAAARAHAWVADRAPVSLLLLGLALHEAADFVAAEAVFDSARAAADEETRTRWDDVRVLLEPDERDRYDDLT